MAKLSRRWAVAGALSSALVLMSGIGLVLYAHEPHGCPPGVAETPSFSDHLRQEDIASRLLSLEGIFTAGEALFTAVFNICDGRGRPAATGSGAPTAP